MCEVIETLVVIITPVMYIMCDDRYSFVHFYHLRLLVQYQFSLSGRSWDQFLIDNILGPTKFWPTSLSKSRLKRRKCIDVKLSVPKLDANLLQIEYDQLNLSRNISVKKGNYVAIKKIPISL